MAALGALICRLNPYTQLPFDSAANMQTGPMEVETQPRPSYEPGEGNETIACMAIEAEKLQHDLDLQGTGAERSRGLKSPTGFRCGTKTEM